MDLSALFREIHRLRRFVRDLQEAIDRYPRSIKTQKGRVEYAEQQLREAQEQLRKLKIDTHQKEVDLKAREGRLESSREKLKSAGVPREIEALNSEIAQGVAACDRLAEEILAGITEIEERTAALPQFEKNLADIREEFQRFEESATAKKAEQEGMLKQAQHDLAEVEKGIPKPVLDQYQRCIKAKGPDALAQVKERVCSACSTTLTAQQLVQLQSNHFLTCSTCGRILYLPPTAPRRDDDE